MYSDRKNSRRSRGEGRATGTRRPRTSSGYKKDFSKDERSSDRPEREDSSSGRDKPDSGYRKDFSRDKRSRGRITDDKVYSGRSRPGSGYKKDFSKEEQSSERPKREGSYSRREKPDSGYKKDFSRDDRTSDRPKREGSFDRKSRPPFSKSGSDRFKKKEDYRAEKRTEKRIESERRDAYFKKDKDRPVQWKTKGGASEKRTSFSKSSQKDDGTIRLNRYIANSGICSRREADDYITAGLISVNGKVVTQLGTKVTADDIVKYNGEQIRKEKTVYVLLNKPKDFITTTDDPFERNTVMALVKNACKERIYPVGRLDRNTTGLLLFTNDGDLAKKLTHPSHGVKKIYQVELDRNLRHEDLRKISDGVVLEDGVAQVDSVAYDGDGNDKRKIGVEIHSGRNRVVRRIFEHLQYDVRKLDRVYFAGLTKKDLPRGRWRFLTEMELNMLRMQTGDKKHKKAEAE